MGFHGDRRAVKSRSVLRETQRQHMVRGIIRYRQVFWQDAQESKSNHLYVRRVRIRLEAHYPHLQISMTLKAFELGRRDNIDVSVSLFFCQSFANVELCNSSAAKQ